MASSAAGPEKKATKRQQIAVACDRCRTSKVKCDGIRPICKRCVERNVSCDYAADPDAPPIVALKRKHDALQRENTEVNELLSHIKAVSQPDAYKIIGFLRDGKDVPSTLNFARNLPAPGAPAELLLASFRDQDVADGSLTPVPYGGFSSNASIALELNAGRSRHDKVAQNRQDGVPGSSDATLPSFNSLMASIEGLAKTPPPPPERRTRMRRSPSAPDLQQVQPQIQANKVPNKTPSPPIWRYDKLLDQVSAQNWDATYVDDAGFRNILSSYFVWDHQAGRPFDEDDFLNGLLGRPSVSCSKLLVHSVLAYGALNYTRVDPETAAIRSDAWIYNRLMEWWDSVHPSIRSFEVLDKAPPHVFMGALLYNFAVQEVLRSFTTTPLYPSPHAQPLKDARLPTEPATSAAFEAAHRQRKVMRRVTRHSIQNQLMGFYMFFALPMAHETLCSAASSSPTHSSDANSAFLAALRLLHHGGKQYTVCRYAALGIEAAATKMPALLPDEAKEIFADIKRRIAENRDQETSRSDWVVNFTTAATDVQGSRLNSLVRNLGSLGI